MTRRLRLTRTGWNSLFAVEARREAADARPSQPDSLAPLTLLTHGKTHRPTGRSRVVRRPERQALPIHRDLRVLAHQEAWAIVTFSDTAVDAPHERRD